MAGREGGEWKDPGRKRVNRAWDLLLWSRKEQKNLLV